MPLDDASEVFDVCDAEDRVIAQAPRGEVHARGLLHRAVHLWVFNSRGEILLHQRSATKDEYPLRYTSSASGHLAAGEDYASAAERELLEELGLRGELRYLTKLPASDRTAREHTVLYRIDTDDPPTPDPDEIAAVLAFTPGAVTELLQSDPDLFSPPFAALWEWWLAHGSGA